MNNDDEDIPVIDLNNDDEDIPVIDLSESDEDVPLIDLGAMPDRESVLADAMAHASLHESKYRLPPSDTKQTAVWKTPVAMIVFMLSAYLLAFPPQWMTGDGLPSIDSRTRENGARAALFLQAQQIEAFRITRGRLPGSLEEVQGSVKGIRFVRSSSRVFQLVVPGEDGINIIYDSSRPVEEFAGAAAAWGVHQR